MRELRLALRAVCRTPGIAIGAALIIALGVGVSGTIYSYIQGTLLHQAAGIPHLDRVFRVELSPTASGDGSPRRQAMLPAAMVATVERRLPSGVIAAAYGSEEVPAGPDDTSTVTAEFVTGSYFRALGIEPVVGRFFDAEDTLPHNQSAALIVSSRLAAARYGSDSAALGQRVRFGGENRTIVGVAAPPFFGLGARPADAWIPANALITTLGVNWDAPGGLALFEMIVALPNKGAAAPLQALLSGATEGGHERKTTGDRFVLRRLNQALTTAEWSNEETSAARLSLAGILLLCMVCANVAGLLLVRGVHQRFSHGVRVALGASSGQMFRMVLLETLILGVVGGTLGLLAILWTGRILRNALETHVHWTSGPVSIGVIGATAGITLTVVLLAGLVPALRAMRTSPLDALKDGGGLSDLATVKSGRWLVTSQVAVSTWLLVVAGLFLNSLHRLRTTDLGFDASRLIYVSAPLDSAHRDLAPALIAGLDNIAPRLRLLPDVEAVAAVASPATIGAARYGGPHVNAAQWNVSVVSGDYFRTMGQKVISGRLFDERDGAAGRSVVILGASTADQLWPGESAVGKCLPLVGAGPGCRTVVGVVGDIRLGPLVYGREMQAYIPQRQATPAMWSSVRLILRMRSPGFLPPSDGINRAFRDVLGDDVHPVVMVPRDRLWLQLRPWRIRSLLFATLAVLALLVTTTGIFSSVSFVVAGRMHELGIRRALGAERRHILRLVLKDTTRSVVYGLEVGFSVALMTGRLIVSSLYGVTAHDVMTFVIVGVIVVVIGVGAIISPALRAIHADARSALTAA